MTTKTTHTSASTQSQKNTALRGIIFTLAGGACWGFSGACGQYLFEYCAMDAFWLTSVRMLLSGVILLGFLLIRQPDKLKQIWQDKQDVTQLLFFALIGLLACQFTYLKAIEHTNAGTATVLQYLGPLLIMIYACVKGSRLPSKREAIAIVFALAGTFLLATHGNIHALVISPQGLFWGIGAAIGLFFYTLIPTRIIGKFGSWVVTGYGMIIGGGCLAIAMQIWNIPVQLDFGGTLALAGIILIGTLVAYTLYLQGVQDIGAVKASMLASVEPVSATLFSALWLHTNFVFMDMIGFFLILTTVFLLAKK